MDSRDGAGLTGYRNQPALLVIHDGLSAQIRAEQAGQAAGCRIIASLSLEQALCSNTICCDAVLVELDGDSGAVLDSLLDHINKLAGNHQCGVIIAFIPELIDRIFARIFQPHVQLLCGPTLIERAAAIGMAALPANMRLADGASEQEAQRIRQLSTEVERIARALATLSNDMMGSDSGDVHDRKPGYSAEPSPEPEIVRAVSSVLTVDMIRMAIRTRRLRERYFPADLFADPAWDMLLDLKAARIEGADVAVSSLCIAAAVPPTTALRWIRVMTDNGLFERHADPQDGRRMFIRLSDKAATGMRGYFAAVRHIGGISA